MERRSNWRKVTKVYNLLEEDGSYLSKLEMLENYERDVIKGRENEKRGDENELKVLEIIKRIPGVKSGGQTPKFSQADMAGRDLSIGLDSELERVYVQVKSSELGIKLFYENLVKSRNLMTQDDVDKWLTDNYLVVINATWDEEEIIKVFKESIEKMVPVKKTIPEGLDAAEEFLKCCEYYQFYPSYIYQKNVSKDKQIVRCRLSIDLGYRKVWFKGEGVGKKGARKVAMEQAYIEFFLKNT